MGATRAQSLAHRTAALRHALSCHWALSDAIGAHFPTMAEAIAASSLIRQPLEDAATKPNENKADQQELRLRLETTAGSTNEHKADQQTHNGSQTWTEIQGLHQSKT